MPEIDKAQVYRKAAEVIVRDGKWRGSLTQQGDCAWDLRNPALKVCALGACARAEYELYGTLPEERGTNTYEAYAFKVAELRKHGTYYREIYYVSDDLRYDAEDIALLLKKRADEVDAG
ncbi:DUF6197 family protein [Streptomyces hydrogenans]|uniref:Uncharacterized protein n=1 Tax=Streptomyces hydrogenans TaxID=1873719 RepID=A0ABQ3PJH5_9ACTN|nr:hypothetical protein [Streptomyces hydrogenans]GHG10261.1 hypothetical protein GCM10018784_23730 [Streptomyces hydrogenans]GHI25175.1 hypothetical protein Shyd_65460 [Streptomyces hydrogenans]